MIDINNKKFNFYDPIKLIEKEKRIESFFSDIIFTLSEKYIPDREKEKVRNQFGNLIMNYANQNPGFQNIYSSFESIISEKIIIKLENKTNTNRSTSLISNFILIDINNNKNFKYIEKNLKGILDKRIIPIISHPERFTVFDKENIKNLKEKGVLFQLSLGSFSSFFGENSKSKSLEYLESGIYDFIASDSINYDQINDEFLEKQINNILKIIGSNKLNELIFSNPKNVIDEKLSNDFQLLNAKRS